MTVQPISPSTPFPAIPTPGAEAQRGLWGDVLNTWATEAQRRVVALETALVVAQTLIAERPVRRVRTNGVYPARAGAEYVEWVGSTDPATQAGLDVRDERDTWINTGAVVA